MDDSVDEVGGGEYVVSRRALLVGGAAAATAAIWVPPIVESFVQPAAAGSSQPHNSCTEPCNGSGFSVVSFLILQPSNPSQPSAGGTAFFVSYPNLNSLGVATPVCGKNNLPGGGSGNGSCGVVFNPPAGYVASTACPPDLSASLDNVGAAPHRQALELTLTGAAPLPTYLIADWQIHQGQCCVQLSKTSGKNSCGGSYPCAPGYLQLITATQPAIVYAPGNDASCRREHLLQHNHDDHSAGPQQHHDVLLEHDYDEQPDDDDEFLDDHERAADDSCSHDEQAHDECPADDSCSHDEQAHDECPADDSCSHDEQAHDECPADDSCSHDEQAHDECPADDSCSHDEHDRPDDDVQPAAEHDHHDLTALAREVGGRLRPPAATGPWRHVRVRA